MNCPIRQLRCHLPSVSMQKQEYMKKNRIKIGLIGILLGSQLYGAEMPRSLREAERLYQQGNYAEAYDKALELQSFYPDNFQGLLVLGMSSFYLNDYESSWNWFIKAQKKSPKHPIVTRYIELLRELEYRSGPFTSGPYAPDPIEPMNTAKFYKKGYLSANVPILSNPEDPGSPVKPMEPILITDPIATSAMRLESDLALPTPYPHIGSILSADYFKQMAAEAMKKQEYEKAYLFYSQLSADEPKNREFIICQAEAAYHLKRFQKCYDLLLPLAQKSSLATLSEENQKKVRELIRESAINK